MLKCKLCKATVNLQKHHVVPRLQGGEDSFLNRIVVCQECHSKLHGRVIGGPTIELIGYPNNNSWEFALNKHISIRVSPNQLKRWSAKRMELKSNLGEPPSLGEFIRNCVEDMIVPVDVNLYRKFKQKLLNDMDKETEN